MAGGVSDVFGGAAGFSVVPPGAPAGARPLGPFLSGYVALRVKNFPRDFRGLFRAGRVLEDRRAGALGEAAVRVGGDRRPVR